ncbi:hypothetical protein EVAR_57594_1 [Eumeta japonica]|uniref:Uncharacterized protein n=1 Tax=Eumeta variegata TaxID=151549 RepID=A0A4C1XXF3_EUMVA|nr:hypothetical protein EVAR_57594_1 [Eumeta japonica]
MSTPRHSFSFQVEFCSGLKSLTPSRYRLRYSLVVAFCPGSATVPDVDVDPNLGPQSNYEPDPGYWFRFQFPI